MALVGDKREIMRIYEIMSALRKSVSSKIENLMAPESGALVVWHSRNIILILVFFCECFKWVI